jgi:hypothetical protein
MDSDEKLFIKIAHVCLAWGAVFGFVGAISYRYVFVCGVFRTFTLALSLAPSTHRHVHTTYRQCIQPNVATSTPPTPS